MTVTICGVTYEITVTDDEGDGEGEGGEGVDPDPCVDGHSFNVDYVEWADDCSWATFHFVCYMCSVTEQWTVWPPDDIEKIDTTATCTEAGVATYRASVDYINCQDYADKTITDPALGHDFDEYGICTRCGYREGEPEGEPEYSIAIAACENGTVEADTNTSIAEVTICLTVQPAEGYVLDTLYYTVEGESNSVKIIDNQFQMPTGNVTVYGEKGTEAERIADLYGFTFVDLKAETKKPKTTVTPETPSVVLPFVPAD